MSLENKIQMLLEALEKNTEALLNASVTKQVEPLIVEVEEPVVEEPVVEEPEPVVEEPEPVVQTKPTATIEDCRVIATYMIKVKKDKVGLSEVLKNNGVTNLTAFTGDTDSFLKDLEDAAGIKLEDCPN
jgi:hypothetical protein